MSYFASLHNLFRNSPRHLSHSLRQRAPRCRIPRLVGIEELESRVLLSGTPTQLIIGIQPTNGYVGLPNAFSFTVEIADANGNIVTGNTSTVKVTIASGPSGGLGGTTSVKAVGGVATFNNLVFSKTGDFTLVATDGALTKGTSDTISIAPALAPTTLNIVQQPVGNPNSSNLTSPIVINVLDQFGNLITTSSNVTLKVLTGPAGGALTGTVTVPTVDGVATFNQLAVTKGGSYVLRATSGTATVDTNSFDMSGPTVASGLVFAQPPDNNPTGASLTAPVIVQVVDQHGNLVTTPSTVSLKILTGPAGGKISGTLAVKTVAGVATFNTVNFNKGGTYVLQAKSGSFTVDSGSFVIGGPAVATSLVFAQPPVGNPVGASVTSPVVVNVLDQYGNLLTTPTNVTLKLATGPTGAKISGTLAVKTVAGVATFNTVTVNKGGSFVLQANAGALNVQSSSFDMGGPAVATTLNILQQPSDTAAGVNMTPAVTVQVLDQYGNVLTSDHSVMKLTVATGPSLTVKASASVKQGVATFDKLQFNAAGPYTLTIGDGALTPVTTSSFNVTAGAATHLAFTQIPATGSPFAGPFTIVVTSLDKFGNIATGNVGDVTIIPTTAPAGQTPQGLTHTAVAGVATFDGLAFPVAGTYVLKASQTLLPSVSSKAFKLI